jgi:hypothetical protein
MGFYYSCMQWVLWLRDAGVTVDAPGSIMEPDPSTGTGATLGPAAAARAPAASLPAGKGVCVYVCVRVCDCAIV